MEFLIFVNELYHFRNTVKPKRRICDGGTVAYQKSQGYIYKKKCILVIFGKFKKRNTRGVGFWIEM